MPNNRREKMVMISPHGYGTRIRQTGHRRVAELEAEVGEEIGNAEALVINTATKPALGLVFRED